jgi:hypothetical protein
MLFVVVVSFVFVLYDMYVYHQYVDVRFVNQYQFDDVKIQVTVS